MLLHAWLHSMIPDSERALQSHADVRAIRAFRAAVVLDVLAKTDQVQDRANGLEQSQGSALAAAVSDKSMSPLTSLPSSPVSKGLAGNGERGGDVSEDHVVEKGRRTSTRDRKGTSAFVGKK